MPLSLYASVFELLRMVDLRDTPDADPDRDIAAVDAARAAWAARPTAESHTLIEPFEATGYAVRGESWAEISSVLRHMPGTPPG